MRKWENDKLRQNLHERNVHLHVVQMMLSEVNAEINLKNVECVKPESSERNILNMDQNEVVGNEQPDSKERKTPRGPN